MDKYVAFIDILGFKEKLKRINQQEAEEFITKFSTMLYSEWKSGNYQNSDDINGYIVSDSIIVYSKNDDKESLCKMMNYLTRIFSKAFTGNAILLRGAVAKGKFSMRNPHSFKNLQKGLLVGEAYIEAYTIENSSKGSLIQLSQTVRNDIQEYYADLFTIEKVGDKPETENSIYSLRWADIDFLLEKNNLSNFVKMANESKWSSHYYETLYMFFTKELKESKKENVLDGIYRVLKEQYKYNDINLFIKNAFSQEVNRYFQDIFLKFLRNKIESQYQPKG